MSDLLEHLRKVSAQVDHDLAMRGKGLVECATCSGSGHSEPGYSDCDAHGSYWVSPVDCRRCWGRGRLEVPCSPEVEAAAVQREIDKLKARLRELKRKKGAGK